MSSKSSAPPATVYERFAAIADAHGDTVAYENGEVSLTYAALKQRADAAKKAVAGLGKKDAGMVGILTADRVNAMIAMLGVAGSGHAYVLLDVNDPDKRLDHIIAEAAPIAILADSGLTARAKGLAGKGCATIDIDALDSADLKEAATLPVTGDSLLYVSFTSGSTGVPKGVCQTHRNLIFYVDCYIDAMDINAGDPISWLFAHGASASNMDIYGALFTGARLCAFEIKNESFEAMADWIDSRSLKLLHTVPTVVRELSGAIAPDRVFDSVTVIDLAGEMLFANDVVKMRPHFLDDCLILNRLAATEASFIASMKITAAHEKAEGALPVGKPPQNLEVSIVGEGGAPAKTGENGFIAISSPHVALGYLNRPDLNEAAFADVDGKPGWRRYTSADLGFIDGDGNLNFIGRSGSRIKLRGQAVDLAEVEAALYECPGVTGAVVLPRAEEGEEAQEILAFLTLAAGTPQEAGDIRKALGEALPAYMLPSGYVFLDKFPQTATSKVDRKKLGELDLSDLRYRPGYMPPEDEAEERVASIFAEVLGVGGVGRLDDFFLLGGDSLSLVNLQIMATETFGRQFTQLHEDATVKGVAEWLRSEGSDGDIHTPVLLPIRTEGRAPPLYVVHGRRGQAHVGPHFLTLLGPHQPLYALQARGLDGKQEPHETIEDMAAEYVAAIREVQPEGPYFIGGFCAGCYVALEMIRLLREQGETFFKPLLIDPPLPNFKSTGEDVPDELLLMTMRKRVRTGEWKVDLENSDAVDAAMKVARAFEDALFRYKRRRIPVRAMIIATVQRWKSRFNVRKLFGQEVHVFLIDGGHGEMMSPDNKQFADAIRRCIGHIAALSRMRKEGRAKPRKAGPLRPNQAIKPGARQQTQRRGPGMQGQRRLRRPIPQNSR